MKDYTLDDTHPSSILMNEWRIVWNASLVKRTSGGYCAKNVVDLVNMLRYSICEIYPSGIRDNGKPLLVTSNEPLFEMIMMSKNEYAKALESRISTRLNGRWVNHECNTEYDNKVPRWIKTRNVVTGEYVFIRVPSHTFTGRGVVIPNPARVETVEDDYIRNFEIFVNNVRDQK